MTTEIQQTRTGPKGWEWRASTGLIRNMAKLSRGDLAILRRNAGNSLAQSRQALTIFERIRPNVPEDLPVAPDWHDEILFLGATLCALSVRDPGELAATLASENTRDFGDTLQQLKKAMPSGNSETHPLDRRMTILLDSTFDTIDGRPVGGELAYRLRQAVKLALSRQKRIDWVKTVADLLRWTHPNKSVQKQWARSYFSTHRQVGGSSSPTEDQDSNDTQPPSDGE